MTTKSLNANTPNIQIQATPEYVAGESQPDLSHYFFAYHIQILNLGSKPAQLISRHWKITNGNGAIHEVKGEGVIGKQPILLPGEEFTYSSACPLDTPMGMMEGSYQMIDSEGHKFDVMIEPFYLNADQYVN